MRTRTPVQLRPSNSNWVGVGGGAQSAALGQLWELRFCRCAVGPLILRRRLLDSSKTGLMKASTESYFIANEEIDSRNKYWVSLVAWPT